VDVEKLVKFVQYMHEFWATLVSASVALYILYSYLGITFLAPFFTTLVTAGMCAWIGKYMRPHMVAWAAATERRIDAIVDTVSNIKGVRMLGLSESVLEMLTFLREQEVEVHGHARRLMVWVLTISNVIFQITSVATYVTFIVIVLVKSTGTALNYNLLYGSLSALKLVTSPLIGVLQLIPMLQTALVSFERIEQFLLKNSLGQKKEKYAIARHEHANEFDLLPLASRNSSLDHDSSRPVIVIEDATFELDKKPLLTKINLIIPKRKSHLFTNTLFDFFKNRKGYAYIVREGPSSNDFHLDSQYPISK
jgi:ATP-binding cassette subfamily C (CFTR/MRP) protein 1